MDASWVRLRALDEERPWLLDSVLAALLFAGAVVSSAVGTQTRPPDATYLTLVAVGAAPYVLRRRFPLAVLLVASAPVLAILGLGYTSAVIGSGLFLAAYSVAAWSDGRNAALAGVWTVGLLVALSVVKPESMTFGELATDTALFAGAIALGRGVTERRRTVTLLADRAELAERARLEEARRAVADERLRIAQELHDVIGHTLGVIALQAGVGAHVIDADPAEAKASLVSVSERSRSALAEVRQILGALRTEEGGGYAPPPGLDALDELVAQLAAAGLPVDLRVEGDLTDVPPALGLTAYRVVQEALTNVVKHAGPAHATVTVRRDGGALLVEVADDGRGAPVTAGGGGGTGGHGQLGMGERVAVWGGALSAGAAPDGGYRVTARLPVGSET